MVTNLSLGTLHVCDIKVLRETEIGYALETLLEMRLHLHRVLGLREDL